MEKSFGLSIMEFDGEHLTETIWEINEKTAESIRDMMKFVSNDPMFSTFLPNAVQYVQDNPDLSFAECMKLNAKNVAAMVQDSIYTEEH